MPNESDFETAIAKYPELIEEGLHLVGRQMTVYGRRMDLVFKDRFHRTLITELKWGPIKDGHMGQIMAYEGLLLSSSDPSIRVMLIGTRVPRNLQLSLDHHGIAWKEITLTELVSFLKSKCDRDLLGVFETIAATPLSSTHNPQVNQSHMNGPGDKSIAVSAALAADSSQDWFQKSLAGCKNTDERQFFESARTRKQPRTLNALRFDDATGRVRWRMKPQVHEAYVVQKGRFPNDEHFWQSRLDASSSVQPRRIPNGDADLRFHLVNKADFATFQEVAETEARVRTLDWEACRRKRAI